MRIQVNEVVGGRRRHRRCSKQQPSLSNVLTSAFGLGRGDALLVDSCEDRAFRSCPVLLKAILTVLFHRSILPPSLQISEFSDVQNLFMANQSFPEDSSMIEWLQRYSITGDHQALSINVSVVDNRTFTLLETYSFHWRNTHLMDTAFENCSEQQAWLNELKNVMYLLPKASMKNVSVHLSRDLLSTSCSYSTSPSEGHLPQLRLLDIDRHKISGGKKLSINMPGSCSNELKIRVHMLSADKIRLPEVIDIFSDELFSSRIPPLKSNAPFKELEFGAFNFKQHRNEGNDDDETLSVAHKPRSKDDVESKMWIHSNQKPSFRFFFETSGNVKHLDNAEHSNNGSTSTVTSQGRGPKYSSSENSNDYANSDSDFENSVCANKNKRITKAARRKNLHRIRKAFLDEKKGLTRNELTARFPEIPTASLTSILDWLLSKKMIQWCNGRKRLVHRVHVICHCSKDKHQESTPEIRYGRPRHILNGEMCNIGGTSRRV